MLHRIVEQKKREVERLKETFKPNILEGKHEELLPIRPFVQNLLHSHRPISVIAEVKKASPSKGLIRLDFDPVTIAKAYEQAGVDAMSVLTDETFFQGNKQYLQKIKEHIPSIPLLRKDFIIDPLQVYEARSIGADCILLIAAILEAKQLTELDRLAKLLGMDVLIEVHNREEIDLVLSCTEPSIIGINNRNLKTFETGLQTTEALLPFIPSHIPVVSESGIHSRQDIEYLERLGVRAVLVGEHFMRQDNIQEAVVELVGS